MSAPPPWMSERWRRRPPWWPGSEPWPPHGPGGQAAWRRMRGRMVRRAAGLLVMLLVLTFSGCTGAFWLAASLLGLVDLPHAELTLARGIGLAALVIGAVGLLLIGRALRRVTAPIDDFMEAVGRVTEGDLTARVSARGPRDARALGRAFNSMVERLQQSEAQRRSLLADVTHELRTPLTVMQGHLEGVLDGVYPADREHLAPILDEMRVLGRLIDDLRTLAQAESGTLTLRREPTDLGVLVGEVAASFRPEAEAAGVTLEVDVADDLPLLAVDPVRLREVLTNLVANALRYTPQGGRVRIGGKATEGGGVELAVSDTGAGIPPEALPHIFDRFYKSADSGGSGLGLAIARNLVNTHGGTLEAESHLGQGTTMRVKLPGE
jgi:two-component system sensor histidine kinase BaeS